VKVLVPVATRGKLLGLLAVGPKRSEEDLSREDIDHLTTIANQGALGLEAAGLHEQLTAARRGRARPRHRRGISR